MLMVYEKPVFVELSFKSYVVATQMVTDTVAIESPVTIFLEPVFGSKRQHHVRVHRP
ncbi:hypothetical protein D3C87_1923700 [compost metagenome]